MKHEETTVKQEMRRSQDMGVRNGKNYVMGLVLVALTSGITLVIAEVARTVTDAPINNAIQAGEIKLLGQQINMVEVLVQKMEQNQREFKKSADKDFKELRTTNTNILAELKNVNATMITHIHRTEE
jgi:hypothetical protein